MSETLTEKALSGSLAEALRSKPSAGLRFYWLGQAGFICDIAGQRLVIDPYLSDSLARKYQGTPRPHIRMMPPPIESSEITQVDYVLCTHAHTDHMDPGTLPSLLHANPQARLIAPRATRAQALERSQADDSRLIWLNAGESVELADGLAVRATRAAHETLDRDADGNHRFLGYCLKGTDVNLWHSGDSIPFDGLVEEVSFLRPDIALLPVNGRRPELSENGVPGNFSLDEAISTTRAIGASTLVAHHYGLFDFNTLDPEVIDSRSRSEAAPHVIRAREAIAFQWSST